MDGSFSKETLPAGLAEVVENVSTFAEVKERVRYWAEERGYFPCCTSIAAGAVVVAYHDSELGYRKVLLPVVPSMAAQFRLEFLASDSGW